MGTNLEFDPDTKFNIQAIKDLSGGEERESGSASRP